MSQYSDANKLSKMILGILFLVFTLLGTWLASYFFNRKFELRDDVLLYTDMFGKTKTYELQNITAIKQQYGGDFACYIDDKKAFIIDQQLSTLLEKLIYALPDSAKYLTNSARQDQSAIDGIIISKMNLGGFIIPWCTFLFPLAMIHSLHVTFNLPSVIIIGWALCGIVYLFYAYRYKVTIDKNKRLLTVRKFIKTKEFQLSELRAKVKINQYGYPIAVKLLKDDKKVCQIDISVAVTNRDIMLELLAKYSI